MAAVAKPPASTASNATLAPELVPNQAQLTPNFFNSIFNDGMNPFDECFGSLTPGGNVSSLLATTLRKELAASNNEKPRVLHDEMLPAIPNKVEPTITPEQSPKSLTMADATINPQLAVSRSPSPFTFSNPFPQSPASSVTPTTSPEAATPNGQQNKALSKPAASALASGHKSRKSVSAPRPPKAATHKRNLSLPQDWNTTIKVLPQIPDIIKPKSEQVTKQGLPKGVECYAKSVPKSRARFETNNSMPFVSRMDGIFVTESIPSSEIKAEPNSPDGAGFQAINSALSGNKKRKRSSPGDEDEDEDEDDDEEMAGLNEGEKRARFLERNRVAASKCRKKKKLMNQRLEEKSRLLVQQNRFLSATLAKLRSDVLRLKQLVLVHHDCKHAPIERYLHHEAGRYMASENDDFQKSLEVNAQMDTRSQKPVEMKEFKNEPAKPHSWLDEFHSFQEVESEVLKRAGHMLEFDDADFQKLLLGDQLDLMDEDFGESSTQQ